MYTDLDRSLGASMLLLKKLNSDPMFVLGSSNKRIVEYFDIPYSQRVLDSYDEFQKKHNFHYYNLLTNKLESVKKTDIVDVTYLGIPPSFVPAWLHSPNIDKDYREKSFEVYFYSMKPFFDKIKEFKLFNINDFGRHMPSEAVLNLNNKLKNLNIVIPENNIFNFVHFIAYSSTLSEAFLKNYRILDYLPNVQYVFKEMAFDLEVNTFDDFCDKLNDDEFLVKLKNVYISYLDKVKNNQISKLTNDLNNLAPTNLIDIQELKAQIHKQINILESFNFENDLDSIVAPSVIYKYWPFDILPTERPDMNEPFYTKKEINLFKILIKEFDEEKSINILANPSFFINEIKELREKQILTHRDNFINEINNDINNTEDEEEKNDLKQIVVLLENNQELYEKELKEKETVTDVLEYWPIMLYPAPSFVLVYDEQ